MANAQVIEIDGVSKSFGANQALDSVDLDLPSGSVRALVGANGCGKSTLVKILAGYHRADAGTLRIGEKVHDLSHGGTAPEWWRVGAVHQDLALIDELTVAENFLLPALAVDSDLKLAWRSLRKGVSGRLASYSMDVPVTTRVEDCPRVYRALLALARATWVLEGRPPLGAPTKSASHEDPAATLILDEITAFLSLDEVRLLRRVVRRLALQGHNILFVSHDLDEILAFADEITVMRDGKVLGTYQAEAVDKPKLFALISGDERRAPSGAVVPSDQEPAADYVVAECTSAAQGSLSGFSVSARIGEVVAVTGLVGSGFEAVPYALAGADPSAVGTLSLAGQRYPLARLSPRDAIKVGVALVPGDRRTQGLWQGLSIAENLLPTAQQVGGQWKLSWASIRRHARQLVADYSVKATSVDSRVSELSGGNAQRVLLAKWMSSEPSLLLLHEPVQGVDVGARTQITELIQQKAASGMSVICASADHDFLGRTAHRVLVFSAGEVRTVLTPMAGQRFVAKEDIVWACQEQSFSQGHAR
jgi:ribose transport system ATP-binding protein